MSALQGPTMDDYRKQISEKENHIRESWVTAMEARLVREELQKCWKGEGTNHLSNCKELAERYAQMIRDNKIKGYKIVDTQ